MNVNMEMSDNVADRASGDRAGHLPSSAIGRLAIGRVISHQVASTIIGSDDRRSGRSSTIGGIYHLPSSDRRSGGSSPIRWHLPSSAIGRLAIGRVISHQVASTIGDHLTSGHLPSSDHRIGHRAIGWHPPSGGIHHHRRSGGIHHQGASTITGDRTIGDRVDHLPSGGIHHHRIGHRAIGWGIHHHRIGHRAIGWGIHHHRIGHRAIGDRAIGRSADRVDHLPSGIISHRDISHQVASTIIGSADRRSGGASTIIGSSGSSPIGRSGPLNRPYTNNEAVHRTFLPRFHGGSSYH